MTNDKLFRLLYGRKCIRFVITFDVNLKGKDQQEIQYLRLCHLVNSTIWPITIMFLYDVAEIINESDYFVSTPLNGEAVYLGSA